MKQEWRPTTWGELATLQYGKSLKAGEREPGDVPVYGTNGRIDYHSSALVEGPGVIVGRKGAYRGVEYCSSDFWVIDTAFWLELREKANVDLRWAWHQLKNFDINNLDSGSALPSTSREAFASIPVLLPPLFIQERIADLLASVDALIENNRRRIELLEETARLLHREWFVNFRYPGHEDVPLVDSELGPIPHGWQVMPFSTAVQINPTVKVDKTQTCPFFTMGDLSERFMSCVPSEDRAGGSGSKFLNGDTLFARITPCLENGKTGLVQTLEPGQVGRGSTEFIVFRGEAISSEMTYLLARDPTLRDLAAKSMTGASGRQRVRNECFDDFHLAVATPGLVEHFSSRIRPSFELVALLERQNVSLTNARDLLLPCLVSGDLDVSDLDLDLETVG